MFRYIVTIVCVCFIRFLPPLHRCSVLPGLLQWTALWPIHRWHERLDRAFHQGEAMKQRTGCRYGVIEKIHVWTIVNMFKNKEKEKVWTKKNTHSYETRNSCGDKASQMHSFVVHPLIPIEIGVDSQSKVRKRHADPKSQFHGWSRNSRVFEGGRVIPSPQSYTLISYFHIYTFHRVCTSYRWSCTSRMLVSEHHVNYADIGVRWCALISPKLVCTDLFSKICAGSWDVLSAMKSKLLI